MEGKRISRSSVGNLVITKWQWSILPFTLVMLYLLIGAFIFRATESHSSRIAQVKLQVDVYQFLLRHNSCLHYTDLVAFGNVIPEYLNQGAVLDRLLDGEAEIESKWNLLEAFVLSLTIITTIGYGDLVPRTTPGRLFCIIYASLGIPLVLYTFATFGKSLIGLTAKYREALDRPIVRRLFKRVFARAIAAVVIVALTVVVLPSALAFQSQGWDFLEAVYFFFITVSTIGFGDLVLRCPDCDVIWAITEKLLFTAYVFVGISVFSALFNAFTSYQAKKFTQAELVIEMKAAKLLAVRRAPVSVPGSGPSAGTDHDAGEEGSTRRGASSADEAEPRARRYRQRVIRTTHTEGSDSADSGIENYGFDGGVDTASVSVEIHPHQPSMSSYPFVQARDPWIG